MKLTIMGFLLVIVVLQMAIIYWKFKSKRISRDKHSIFQLIESSTDVVYYYNLSRMKFEYISPSIEIYLGKGVIEEAIQNPQAPFERVHPDDYVALCKKVKGEIDYSQILIQRWKDTSGNYRWFEEYATPIYENGQLVAVQGIMRNMDEKIKLQQELEYRISHDTLTDIYNRDYFKKKFEDLDKKINVPVALIMCDLDDLKYVNDHFGHKAGDVLIKNAADLLSQFSSETITVARIGGDEFILIVTNQSEQQVGQLVATIHKKIETINGNDVILSMKISMGYSYAPYSLGQMDLLFTQADKQMYIDKMSKKEVFAENMI